MPEGSDSDAVIRHARERFGLALGVGLGQIKGKVLRIGHLGALNELEVLGTLGGVELALKESGVPLELGAGVAAAQRSFFKETEVEATPRSSATPANGAARPKLTTTNAAAVAAKPAASAVAGVR